MLTNVRQFHMGHSNEGVLTICSNGSVPYNKMATMPIYFSRTPEKFMAES